MKKNKFYSGFVLSLVGFAFFFGMVPEHASAQSTVFNEACYLARYPDVRNSYLGTALSHWENYGSKPSEKRIPGCDPAPPVQNTPGSPFAPLVFNEACYLARYPDVKNNYGGTALSHWQNYGSKPSERRNPGCDSAPSADFNEACYLARYPDVVEGWVKPGKSAVSHWLEHGSREGRNPGCDGDGSPNAVTSSGGIRVEVSPAQFAGAVSSVTWNGLEFINNHDHGRQLQTAIQIDGYGECNNPTEAGSARDGRNATSTSQLQGLNKISGSEIATKSQMALWAFGYLTGACVRGIDPRLRSPLSDHYLEKNIKLDALNDPQIIQYSVKVTHSANTYSEKVVYEFLTGYLNPEFSRFYYSRLSTGGLHEFENYETLVGMGFPTGSVIGRPSKDMFDPVILSTDSGSHAMGVYVAKSAIVNCGSLFHGYNVYKFNLGGSGTQAAGSNKWSLALEDQIGSACIVNNTRSFNVYLVVGSLQEVHAKLLMLGQRIP